MAFETALAKLEFDKVLQRVIRYASSQPGVEFLQSLPVSTTLNDIREELSRVSEVKRLLIEEKEFPLDGIFPIRHVIQQASVEGAVLRPRDLLHIASTLGASRLLRTFVAKRKEQYALLWNIVEPVHVDKVIEYNIEQAIDESGAVRASASKELQTIRRSISDKYDHLRKRLEGILKEISDQGFSQEDIITTREGRMVIPVKTEHKHRVPGFIHSASASGATVFIEPTETLELNNEIRNLQFQEEREIERILRALTIQVGHVRDALLITMDILSRIDGLHAKAKYSIEVLGTQPEVHDDGPIRLLEARHPILVLNHGYRETVPLDLELGGTYNTLVVSGPNAGGKSVAMKTVGLLVLMVQAGLHIPASDQSRMRIFQDIFVDIGDEQSIENDLSTFSSHLRNLKSIAERGNADNLVLIDEIGSGTDPAEGGAIAAAFLELLTRRNAYTIATTHHGALKLFAYETDGVENAAMEFDQETLTPTYRLRAGVPGSSYALEMAGRLGFEQSLLARARALLGSQQTKLDELIIDLERSTQRHEQDVEYLRREKNKLDELVRQYESRISRQATELKELKRKALREAKEIVEHASAAIQRTIKEIKESAASKPVIKHAQEEIHRLKAEILTGESEVTGETAEETQPQVRVGDLVNLLGGMENGEVISVSAESKTAVVVFGNVKMKVPTSDLAISKQPKLPSTRVSTAIVEKPPAVQHDLDLRGLTSDEAIPMVDKFLDDALIAGLHRVDIIHGKGTGALRKKVTEYLSQHPRVKSFRLGEWNEGGTGATVVELSNE